MLARAERDLFAGDGEQGGSPEAMQLETVSHMSARVLLIRFKIKHPNQRRVNTLICKGLGHFFWPRISVNQQATYSPNQIVVGSHLKVSR